MNFVSVVNEQSFRLLSRNYVDHLWKIISIDSKMCILQSTYSTISEKDYRGHLPIDLEGFLQSCLNSIVKHLENNTTPNWKRLDQIYFNTFLYWSMQQRSEVDVLVPTLAARIYFLINSLEKQDCQNTCFDVSYCETLNVINYLHSINYYGSAFLYLLEDFNTFLRNNRVSADYVNQTINILFSVASWNVNVVHSNFSLGSPITTTTTSSYLAFICLKTVFTSICDKTFVVSFLLNKHNDLCSNFDKNRLIIGNIESLICDLKPHLNDEILLSLKSLHVLDEYSDYNHLIPIINSLDYHDYINFTNCLMEVLHSSDSEKARICFSKVGIGLMKFHHPDVDRKGRVLPLLNLLLDTYFSLLVDDSREMGCFFIDAILDIKEPGVKNAISIFLNRDINHSVNLHSILDVLQNPIDILWRKSNYNVLYINIICKLSFIRPQILFTGSVLNVIEKLCLEAPAVDLKPCVENLSTVMSRNYNQPLVVEKMLNVLIHFVLMPVAVSSFYCKLLSKTMFEPILNKRRPEVAIEIANILISNNYDYVNVFDKLHIHCDITSSLFNLLLYEQVPVNRKAWKLLRALCNVRSFDYSIKNVLTIIDNLNVMLDDKDYNTANSIFSVAYKVLKHKTAVSADEMLILKNLQIKIQMLIAKNEFPLQCITNAVAFFKFSGTLRKDLEDVAEMFTVFQNKLQMQMNTIIDGQSVDDPLFQRNALYYANLCLMCNIDIDINDEMVKFLETILEYFPVRHNDFLNQHPWVWTSCLATYTAICVRNKAIVGDITNRIFLHTFLSQNVNVNVHGINYYYDLCNLYLDDFTNLVTHIFRLIDKRDSYFAVHCVKIIERLVMRDYIRLTEHQFLKLVSFFSDENYHVNEAIKYILGKNFLAKTNHLIASHFTKGIIYYNHFKGHPRYSLPFNSHLDRGLSKFRRYAIYKCLFAALSEQKQFNVLVEITTEIIEPLLNNKWKVPWAVFTDGLYICFLFACHHCPVEIKSCKEDYERCITDIVSMISMKRSSTSNAIQFSKFHDEIELLLKNILCIPCYILKENEFLYTEVLEVIFSLLRCFLSEIEHMITRSNHSLVKLLRNFCSLYKENISKVNHEKQCEESFQYFEDNARVTSTPTKRSGSLLMTFDLNL